MPAQSPSDPPMLDTMSTHDMLAVMVTSIVDRVLLKGKYSLVSTIVPYYDMLDVHEDFRKSSI